MRRTTALSFAALLAAGCNDVRTTPTAPQGTGTKTTSLTVDSDEAEIKENLAKLSPEDRALAEKQQYCVEQTDSLLGSMGVPAKLMIKGEPVFICCKHCEKHALKNPDKTLARAKELREKNSK